MTGFREILTENILAFWSTKMVDQINGGFYGRIDGNDVVHPLSTKGAVLNLRILWTFSAAYRELGGTEYRQLAERSFDYIRQHFIDKTYGGVYWELDYKGNPLNCKKQLYAQGFAVYAFSEYYRATGNEEALVIAKNLFLLIERGEDKTFGGYFEAFTQDWHPIDDMRLSPKDANEKKTMNTHLHILEAYTNLFRIWQDSSIKGALTNLINLFAHHFIDKQTAHLRLFFDEQWRPKSAIVSYGHDIEASWLLVEACEVLNDIPLIKKILPLSLRVANAALEGMQPDGSLIYERDENELDKDRHWWVQAEAIVGLMYAHKATKDNRYKNLAHQTWSYIQSQLVDQHNGEWFWSRNADGTANRLKDKAGFWKCPYHNSRCCLEMMKISFS